MSKRNYEKRMREDEEAAAHVFQDFLTSFQDVPSAPVKMFIKSGIMNANQAMNTTDLTKGQIYMPKPLIPSKNLSMKTALECAKILKETELCKSKNKEKPRSNLETLKEEIKQRQLQKVESNSSHHQSDTYDPSSTNLFVANLNPKMSEEQLMILFGKYGALASVKIMWPRGEEKFRNFPNSNCGFVAFMSRKDAERALVGLGYRDDMRLSWGKSVEIPSHPIYIPPKLTKLFLPPPYSGLPFNAQPTNPFFEHPRNCEELELLLSKSVVKVTIPLDKKMLCIIHRMVEFVVREGPLFEASIMMTEVNNPDFAFLFDYRSSLHVYYRWKLFSIMNGDGQKSWSLKPFRMVKGGPVWVPPIPMDYTAGLPDDLIEDDEGKIKNELLSEAQISRLKDLIKNLNMSRNKIHIAMSFCINHVDAINDSLSVIFDSLKHSTTNPIRKISRLYLLSDIFCNCKRIKGVKLTKYETSKDLDEIFQSFHSALTTLEKFDRDHLKTRVLSVLRAWHNHRVFSSMFLEKLEGFFLENDDEDFSSDEPLDGASLLKRTSVSNKDVKLVQQPAEKNHFISSCWNRVDPKDLESQAMSTQKLYELELCRIEGEEEGDRRRRKERKRKKKDYSVTVSSKWDSDEEI